MTTRAAVVARALSQVNALIGYELGQGGFDASAPSPAGPRSTCDCSGSVCWVMGESRFEPSDPYFGGFGGWLSTDSIAADATTPDGHYQRTTNVQPGDVLVYPHRVAGHHGHIGVVTAAEGGRPTRVVHCSPSNGPRAIQETGPEVFLKNGAIAATHYSLAGPRQGKTMATAHPLYKLGKLPAKADPHGLRFSAVRADVRPAPPEYDFDALHLVGGKRIPTPMFGNDQLGDCVMAGRAHQTLRFELLEQGKLLPITDKDVETEYFRESGGADGGLVVLDSLDEWRTRGWKAGGQTLKIEAHAHVDPTNPEELRAAAVARVGIACGLMLPLSAQDQVGKVWDVVKGRKGKPGGWGGHYVYSCTYNRIGPKFITWGLLQQATWAFVAECCDEAQLIIDAIDKAKGIDGDAVRAHLRRAA